MSLKTSFVRSSQEKKRGKRGDFSGFGGEGKGPYVSRSPRGEDGKAICTSNKEKIGKRNAPTPVLKKKGGASDLTKEDEGKEKISSRRDRIKDRGLLLKNLLEGKVAGTWHRGKKIIVINEQGGGGGRTPSDEWSERYEKFLHPSQKRKRKP